MKHIFTNRPQFRPSKNTVALVFSVSLAVFGVFYSKVYIENEVELYRQQFDTTEAMTQLVVPKRRMERGEVVVSEDLSVREVPSKYADSNSVMAKTYETALGQRLSSAVDEGRPLLWAHLESGRTQTFSGKVPAGLRAITVRVDEINSISGFLQPKDRVDLLMSYGSQSDNKVMPLLQNVEVIATGRQTLVDKSGGAGSRAFNTITVKVTPEEAKRITLSQEVGKLTAMLRNPADDAPLDVAPLSIGQLLNTSTPVVPKKIARKAPLTRQKTRTIEYIIGGT